MPVALCIIAFAKATRVLVSCILLSLSQAAHQLAEAATAASAAAVLQW